MLLWFSKKEVAKKNLLAAFDVLLIGRKDDKADVLKGVQSKLPAMTQQVANGANPYEVAALAVQSYILSTLKALNEEERVAFLKRIADNNFKMPPRIFALISHVNYCLIILEDKSKPLIPVGSAEGFLTTICRWFGKSEQGLQRVYLYFSESTQIHRYELQQIRKKNERSVK